MSKIGSWSVRSTACLEEYPHRVIALDDSDHIGRFGGGHIFIYLGHAALIDAVTARLDAISEIQPLFALTAINGSEPIRR
jgi:hypothetical protein